jgi:hypothetical protein
LIQAAFSKPKAKRPNDRVDAAADDCATDKLWMRSPLTPLASNDLFARP